MRLLWVAAEGLDDWTGPLAEDGFEVHSVRAADASGAAAALRDPVDAVVAWDDAAGERAGEVLAAVRAAGAAVPVAVVGPPAVVPARLRALDSEAAALLEADRPLWFPAALRRVLDREWLRVRIALTGRIAHDLNNLLAPIPLAVQLLQRSEEPDAARGPLGAVDAATRRSMGAVKELSELQAAQEPTVLPVRAKHLLSLASAPWRHFGDGAMPVLTEYPPDLGTVRLEVKALLQCLWCFSRRAIDGRDGADGPAELRFSGRPLERLATTGRAGVELRVVCGPPVGFEASPSLDPVRGPEASDALAAIQEIVAAQGGELAVLEGGPGKVGFVIHLPAHRPGGARPDRPGRPHAGTPVPRPVPPQEPRRSARRGRTTGGAGRSVLVIEGDGEIRRMTRETLERSGWNVLVAEDGTEGVAVFAEHLATVCAVLVDLALPYMDGVATIKALRRIGDHVPMVLTTGGDWDLRRLEIGDGAPDAVLRKPYDTESLLQALGGAGG